MNRATLKIVIFVAVAAPGFSFAAVIDFDGVAPAGSATNVSPGFPYIEKGFQLTTSNDESAVFDSAYRFKLMGRNSDFFAFAESNSPSLTLVAASQKFNLNSLLAGRSTIAGSPSINLTVTGHLFGGGTVVSHFSGVSTATRFDFNWSNLSSLVFVTSDDAGLDDIDVTPVPEPVALTLAVPCLIPLAVRASWRKKRLT